MEEPNGKVLISQSLDHTKIYIDDDEHDERLVIIDFMDKYSNENKAKILRGVADWIQSEKN